MNAQRGLSVFGHGLLHTCFTWPLTSTLCCSETPSIQARRARPGKTFAQGHRGSNSRVSRPNPKTHKTDASPASAQISKTHKTHAQCCKSAHFPKPRKFVGHSEILGIKHAYAMLLCCVFMMCVSPVSPRARGEPRGTEIELSAPQRARVSAFRSVARRRDVR